MRSQQTNDETSNRKTANTDGTVLKELRMRDCRLWIERVLFVFSVVQIVLLMAIFAYHVLVARGLTMRAHTLQARTAKLMSQPCRLSKVGGRTQELIVNDRDKRFVGDSGTLQLAQQLEGILASHCGHTSYFCVPGMKGDEGDPGSTGSRGRRGLPGPMGPKGLPGLGGERGSKGETGRGGPAGPEGQTGEQGVPGNKGPTGSPGLRGQTGSRGPKGDTGAAGIKGLPGDVGPPGPQGSAGLRGDVGIPGAPGDVGAQGQKGSKGAQGQPGPTCHCFPKGHQFQSQPRQIVTTCDFERGMCDWTRPSTTYGWRRGGLPRFSDFTGPSTDHTTGSGHYMFTNAFFGLSQMTTEMTSLPLHAAKNYCLEFWYFLHGTQAGGLTVRIQEDGRTSQQLWQVSGDQGTIWQQARVSVTSRPRDFRFKIEALFGGQFNADVFVDDITIYTGSCQ